MSRAIMPPIMPDAAPETAPPAAGPILPDHPSGAALLDVARRALLDEIAPSLSGRQRYVALMVANAVGIAMREIEGAEATARAWEGALAAVPAPGAESPAALVAAIRAGRADGCPDLHGALCRTVDVAADIWKPAGVARDCRGARCGTAKPIARVAATAGDFGGEGRKQ